MKLTPDDEASIPSREAFYGVGSSRTSLCPSPEEENVKEDVSCDALSKNVYRNNTKDELERIPLSGMVCDIDKIQNGMVVADNQQKCDHHEGDVDLDGVSRQFKGDNDVNERRIGQENDEGSDDVAKKCEERLSTDNNVDVDVDIKCHDPQVKDDVVDDPNCNGTGLLEGKLRTSMQQDENDEDNGDPLLSHPPTKISPTDSPSTIQYSVSGDLRRSSQLPRRREHGEPSQQALGSTRSLHSSMSKRQNKSSRRSSGASRRTIRSERSSSLSSTASLETSTTSSSGSTSESDSSSNSSDSNSNTESNSSSVSSSSGDSSSCSSCNESSDGESSDSEPSSSGSESESSSNDEADSDDIRYRISAEKYRRTSRRGSGPSSSVSFGPDEHADMRTDKKSGGKRSHKTRKPSYSMIPQRRGYDLTDGIVHQETCSTVCVIL